MLSYIRAKKKYLHHIMVTLSEIHEQTGWPVASLFFGFVRCYLHGRIQVNEFRSLRLYEYSGPMLDQFLIWRKNCKISDLLCHGYPSTEEIFYSDKYQFNQHFARFIRRDWLYLPDSTPEQLAAFLARHETFLVKPCRSTQGHGIQFLRRDQTDPKTLLEKFGSGAYLLEEIIQQHPVLAAVNPDSVNTVRIIAARKGSRVVPIGAGLRCGGAGQFVDNFHHGGVAYPLDLETGIVTARGADLDGMPVLCHPTTGHIMPGLQVPFWDELLDTVRQATFMTEHIGYIGWDVAILPDGVELIEGNIKYPGNIVFQLDGPGAYQRLKDLLNSPD